MNKLDFKTECSIPTSNGDFQFHLFNEKTKSGEVKEHIALVMGDVRDQTNVIMRIHSECCTGDIFGCQRCDCQDQLNGAMDMIRRRAKGILLYLRQEGRGIGLENKLKAYQLQDTGLDTFDANIALGFEGDYREYDIAAEMVNHLGVKSVQLISNNSNKVNGLRENGITVSKRVPIIVNSPVRDRTNLFKTKQKKLGHLFDALDDIPILEEPTDDKYELTSPSLFVKNRAVPEVSIENTEMVKERLIEEFGDNLSCLLFQGSNMRGDGSIFESDFDYICIFKSITPDINDKFAEIKRDYPRTNFLYLSEEEYSMYPKNSRLQFFITRRVFGEFNLGSPPCRKDVLDTAIKFAIQLKDSIRPLLFEFINNPKNRNHLDQAHVILKRVDDCFMRVVCLYLTGKYPLHRDDLKEIAKGQSVNEITQLIDQWYTSEISTRELCEGLKTADRLINIFLRLIRKNKI